MHLYGEMLEQYQAGELEPGALAAIDAHVGNCLFCTLSLADQGARLVRWENRGWLGRLRRVDDDAHVRQEASVAVVPVR